MGLSLGLRSPGLGAAEATLRKKAEVYERPDEDSKVLKELKAGKSLRTFKTAPGGWIKIRRGDTIGWIKAYKLNGAKPAESGLDAPIDQAANQGAPVAAPAPVAAAPSSQAAPAPVVAQQEEDLGLDELDDEAPPTAKKNSKKKSGSRKSAPDDQAITLDYSTEDYEEEVRAGLERKVALRSGRLYDKPSSYAQRFGVIEAGDEIQLLESSETGDWSQVRLKVTGEEGWIPTQWIQSKRERALPRAGNSSLEFEAGYATNDYNFGGGGGYFFNVAPRGFEGRTRDRLELGIGVHYFVGLDITKGTASSSSRFLSTHFLARYVGVSAASFWSGGIEAGLSYVSAMLANSGISEEVLAQNRLGAGASGVRPVLGLRVAFAQNGKIQFPLGARAIVGSSFVIFTYVGCNLRF